MQSLLLFIFLLFPSPSPCHLIKHYLKQDPQEVHDLLESFDGVHLEQLTEKVDQQQDNTVFYTEDNKFIKYNITTRKLPVWFTTDDFQIQTNKRSLVVVASTDYKQKPFLDMEPLSPLQQLTSLQNRNMKFGYFNKNTQLSPYMKIKCEFRYDLRGSTVMPIMSKSRLQNGSFRLIVQYDKGCFDIPVIRDVYKYEQLPDQGDVTNYQVKPPT